MMCALELLPFVKNRVQLGYIEDPSLISVSGRRSEPWSLHIHMRKDPLRLFCKKSGCPRRTEVRQNYTVKALKFVEGSKN